MITAQTTASYGVHVCCPTLWGRKSRVIYIEPDPNVANFQQPCVTRAESGKSDPRTLAREIAHRQAAYQREKYAQAAARSRLPEVSHSRPSLRDLPQRPRESTKTCDRARVSRGPRAGVAALGLRLCSSAEVLQRSRVFKWLQVVRTFNELPHVIRALWRPFRFSSFDFVATAGLRARWSTCCMRHQRISACCSGKPSRQNRLHCQLLAPPLGLCICSSCTDTTWASFIRHFAEVSSRVRRAQEYAVLFEQRHLSPHACFSASEAPPHSTNPSPKAAMAFIILAA